MKYPDSPSAADGPRLYPLRKKGALRRTVNRALRCQQYLQDRSVRAFAGAPVDPRQWIGEQMHK
jgi:hypothetical protein